MLRFLVIAILFLFVKQAFGDLAASVNGEIISRTEFELAVAETLGSRRGETLPQEDFDRVLQALVDERLLVQAARKSGMDREIRISEDVERNRRQVLVEAFLYKKLGGLPTVDSALIDRYVSSHPRHFSQRQTYHYLRLRFPLVLGLSRPRLQEALRTHKQMENLRAWARRNGWPLMIESRWQASEQLDERYLDLLEKLGNGELGILVESDSGQIAIVKKMAAYPDPIDVGRARGAIARGLQADSRSEALQALVAELRAQTKIDYVSVQGDPLVLARAGNFSVDRASVDREFQRQGISSPTPEATRKVVDAVINEHLVHSAAQEARILNEAELTPLMERAERRLLGALYLERVLQRVDPPLQHEVDALVAQRPELFKARKIFRFRQLLLQPDATPAIEEVRKTVEQIPDWDRLDRHLTTRGWVGARSALWLGPEQLDKATLAALNGMADGELRVLAQQVAAPVVILQRLSTHDDPFDVDQASEFAAQALLAQYRSDAAKKLLADLRESARITVAKDLTIGREKLAAPLQTESWSAGQWGCFTTAIFLALLLTLCPAALVWFLVQTRRKTEFKLSFPQQHSLRERIVGFSHSGPFMFIVVLLAVASALVQGGLLGYLLRGTLTLDRLIAAGVTGLCLGLVGSALLLLRLRGRAQRAFDNRWWPLLGLLGSQASALLALRWGLA